MTVDTHIHMLLDGLDFRAAINTHRERPREDLICSRFAHYKDLGYTYLRDGGDRWGVALRARALSGEYGITYHAPAFPMYKKGHYGSFIGRGFETHREYLELLRECRLLKADFAKLMISGLMDFNQCGRLTEDPLPPEEIKELIHIAKEEGFSVMVHGNGTEPVLAAAEAGAWSVEHGAYLHREALCAMAECETVWVPTLSAIGNLLHTERFPKKEVEAILEGATENVANFAHMDGFLAPGSDAGAYAVFHGEGGMTEMEYLQTALGEGAEDILRRGIERICAFK